MATDWNKINSETRVCIPIEKHHYSFDDRDLWKMDFIEPDSGEKFSAQYDPSYWSSFSIGVPGNYIFKRHHFIITNAIVNGKARNIPSYTLMLIGMV